MPLDSDRPGDDVMATPCALEGQPLELPLEVTDLETGTVVTTTVEAVAEPDPADTIQCP